MDASTLHLFVACFLVAMVLILIPMVPGGVIDTRDFAELPRWQFNTFNVFLTSLGIASFVVAGFALARAPWVFVAALVLALLYCAVFAFDLAKIFPAVTDPLPTPLIILEVIDLALGGVLAVIAIQGMLWR